MSMDELKQIINGFHGKDFYVVGEIPQKKLAASTAFHGVDPRDTVLVLLDSTLMGSAENGMSITLKGVYWKNMWAVKTRKTFYAWEDLVNIYESMEIVSGNVVFEPGVQFSPPPNYPNESVLNLIRALTIFFIELNGLDSNSTSEAPSSNAQPSKPEQVALPSNTPNAHADYETALINGLSLCVCHSGSPDEALLDLAIEFIRSEEKIQNKSLALDRLSSVMERLEVDSKKAAAFLKLSQSKLIAECKPLSSAECEHIQIMIEGVGEAANDGAKERIKGISEKLFAVISG